MAHWLSSALTGVVHYALPRVLVSPELVAEYATQMVAQNIGAPTVQGRFANCHGVCFDIYVSVLVSFMESINYDKLLIDQRVLNMSVESKLNAFPVLVR